MRPPDLQTFVASADYPHHAGVVTPDEFVGGGWLHESQLGDNLLLHASLILARKALGAQAEWADLHLVEMGRRTHRWVAFISKDPPGARVPVNGRELPRVRGRFCAIDVHVGGDITSAVFHADLPRVAVLLRHQGVDVVQSAHLGIASQSIDLPPYGRYLAATTWPLTSQFQASAEGYFLAGKNTAQLHSASFRGLPISLRSGGPSMDLRHRVALLSDAAKATFLREGPGRLFLEQVSKMWTEFNFEGWSVVHGANHPGNWRTRKTSRGNLRTDLLLRSDLRFGHPSEDLFHMIGKLAIPKSLWFRFCKGYGPRTILSYADRLKSQWMLAAAADVMTKIEELDFYATFGQVSPELLDEQINAELQGFLNENHPGSPSHREWLDLVDEWLDPSTLLGLTPSRSGSSRASSARRDEDVLRLENFLEDLDPDMPSITVDDFFAERNRLVEAHSDVFTVEPTGDIVNGEPIDVLRIFPECRRRVLIVVGVHINERDGLQFQLTLMRWAAKIANSRALRGLGIGFDFIVPDPAALRLTDGMAQMDATSPLRAYQKGFVRNARIDDVSDNAMPAKYRGQDFAGGELSKMLVRWVKRQPPYRVVMTAHNQGAGTDSNVLASKISGDHLSQLRLLARFRRGARRLGMEMPGERIEENWQRLLVPGEPGVFDVRQFSSLVIYELRARGVFDPRGYIGSNLYDYLIANVGPNVEGVAPEAVMLRLEVDLSRIKPTTNGQIHSERAEFLRQADDLIARATNLSRNVPQDDLIIKMCFNDTPLSQRWGDAFLPAGPPDGICEAEARFQSEMMFRLYGALHLNMTRLCVARHPEGAEIAKDIEQFCAKQIEEIEQVANVIFVSEAERSGFMFMSLAAVLKQMLERDRSYEVEAPMGDKMRSPVWGVA